MYSGWVKAEEEEKGRRRRKRRREGRRRGEGGGGRGGQGEEEKDRGRRRTGGGGGREEQEEAKEEEQEEDRGRRWRGRKEEEDDIRLLFIVHACAFTLASRATSDTKVATFAVADASFHTATVHKQGAALTSVRQVCPVGNPDLESWMPLPAPLRWTWQVEIIFQAPYPHE